MGQYYKPIILSENNTPITYGVCYDFGSGAKLMEHSWMKNEFVGFIESFLSNSPQKIVWAGDYADEDHKLTESQIKVVFKANQSYYDKPEHKEAYLLSLREGVNLHSFAERFCPKLTHNQDVENKYEHDFGYADEKKYKYLINYDKKEFVDKSKVPADKDGWKIHPLPLLTCEGNGRGGGDYRKGDSVLGKRLVGRWSRDRIGVTSKKSDIPNGFEEILFNLVE